MNNLTRYEDEIKNCNYDFGLTVDKEIRRCEEVCCDNCMFNKDEVPCGMNRIKWLTEDSGEQTNFEHYLEDITQIISVDANTFYMTECSSGKCDKCLFSSSYTDMCYNKGIGDWLLRPHVENKFTLNDDEIAFLSFLGQGTINRYSVGEGLYYVAAPVGKMYPIPPYNENLKFSFIPPGGAVSIKALREYINRKEG